MRESTETLLRRLFPPDTFAAMHFVAGGEKGRTCNAIGAAALVDDQIPNIIDACECGVVAVLFDLCGSYPWSVCNPEELPAASVRLETWAATCDYLLSALRLGGPLAAPGVRAPCGPAPAAELQLGGPQALGLPQLAMPQLPSSWSAKPVLADADRGQAPAPADVAAGVAVPAPSAPWPSGALGADSRGAGPPAGASGRLQTPLLPPSWSAGPAEAKAEGPFMRRPPPPLRPEGLEPEGGPRPLQPEGLEPQGGPRLLRPEGLENEGGLRPLRPEGLGLEGWPRPLRSEGLEPEAVEPWPTSPLGVPTPLATPSSGQGPPAIQRRSSWAETLQLGPPPTPPAAPGPMFGISTANQAPEDPAANCTVA